MDGLALIVALVWAALAAAVASLYLPASALVVAAAATVAVTLWMARWLHQRLGGYTGDALGAMQQFSELAVYLSLAAVLASG